MQGGNNDQPSPVSVEPGGQFQPGEIPNQPDSVKTQGDPNSVSWEASEYIHHQKGAMWYLGLFGAVLLLAAAIYLLLDDIFAAVVIVVMGIVVSVVAGKKPNLRHYELSQDSLTIGSRRHDLSEFRSFTLHQGPEGQSVSLWPTKRFTPPLGLHFGPAEGERIVNFLSALLPYEERQPDVVDRWLERIRF